MTVTVTAPAANIAHDARGAVSTESASTDLEVWITASGSGSRVAQIPADQIVSCTWSEKLDAVGSSSATVVIDHHATYPDDSFVADDLRRVEREIQIAFAGRVVHWGPIVSVSRTVGGPTLTVEAAGPEYWLDTRLIDADETVWGVEQIRGTREWDPSLDVTTTGFSAGGLFSYRTSDWRFTAEVFVKAGAPSDYVVLSVSTGASASDPGQGGRVLAGSLQRDQWVTAVIHTTFTSGAGAGGAPRSWSMTVGGGGGSAGDVLVREVSAQVSSSSVGVDETEVEVEKVPVRDMWMEVFARVADLGLTGWVDGALAGKMEASWRRPDVQVIEVARMIVESGYAECAFALSETTRVGVCVVRRGVAHNPGDLTLSAVGADPTVVSWGTWASGLTHPVTEWIVANDEGFTGSYHNGSMFGGLKLQTYVAAPTGTPVTALEHRAIWASIEAESSLSESLSAMVRMDLVSVLGVGDRVHVSIDDGPSQIDTLWRVVGKTVESSAAAFSVELSPWVEGPP